MVTRVSDRVAEMVDEARGSHTVSEWVRDLIHHALHVTDPVEEAALADPVVREAVASAKTGGPGKARKRARPADATADCKHPRARVHKGLCGACGVHVG